MGKESSYKELLDNGINDFVKEFVAEKAYQKKFPKHHKIVHDPLWGTIKLEPWEVALLDLPLFQKLRQVRQTSLVSYVFPGCSHTRFEHTLGVIQQTQRLIDAVNKQYEVNKPRFEPTAIRNLRLAALFHDSGHSCFSHISEDLYGSCSDLVALFNDEETPKCHPHEAFSKLILESDSVREYLGQIQDHYRIEFDIDHAAQWIIGKPADSSSRKFFETQVINGPFDADKLDYIFRDAHYSGIPVGLDLDRLWASCKDEKQDDDSKVLTLHQASVSPLEQILFSKINLFATVYQHPKVRAAEKMFQAIIEEMKENTVAHEPFKASGRVLDLNRATDYLWLTDEVFFAQALFRKKDDPIHKRIHDIRYRRFFVRALTISNDTTDKSCSAGFMQVRKLNQRGADTYKAKREIAKAIIEAAKLTGELDIRDVWVDLPTDPSFGEADRTFVRTAAGTLRKVSDLFPIHYWSELYQKYKWRGHVFCPEKYQQQIHDAALEVFADKFELKFQKSAGESAHVPIPRCTA